MLSQGEERRYGRQIILPGFGEAGQERLGKARVLVCGVGGLGSPVSIYLVAAGVGHLRIVDRDVVELSNLNRQILHWTDDVEKKKVVSAREKLERFNPHVDIETFAEEITEDSIGRFAEACDVIVDALDNFPTRYLLNKIAIERKIPLIYGGIYGIEGAITTIIPGKTPCLRCLFPVPPPPSVFPVMGVAPGIIGSIQALEAIKYITGMGGLLTNRMLFFDGVSSEFRQVNLRRDPLCPDCAVGCSNARCR